MSSISEESETGDDEETSEPKRLDVEHCLGHLNNFKEVYSELDLFFSHLFFSPRKFEKLMKICPHWNDKLELKPAYHRSTSIQVP